MGHEKGCERRADGNDDLPFTAEDDALGLHNSGIRVDFYAPPSFPTHPAVGPTLVELLRPFERKILCSFIYGSIARAEEHAGSGIDLMVIGAVTLSELTPALRAAEKRLQREVNVINCSAEEFRGASPVSALDTAHNVNYVTWDCPKTGVYCYAPSGAEMRLLYGAATGLLGIASNNVFNKRLQPVTISAASPSQTIFSLSYAPNNVDFQSPAIYHVPQ